MENKSIIYYSGLILDEEYRNRLHKTYMGVIPEGWEFIGKYVLMNMGEIHPDLEHLLGFSGVGINVVSFGYSEDVLAVGVSNISTKTEVPHIVLAVKDKSAYHPEIGNKITSWSPLRVKNQFRLRGSILEVPYNLE